jgi:hypothetical protein
MQIVSDTGTRSGQSFSQTDSPQIRVGGTMFFAAWLLHSIRLAAALGMALLAMQAPAITREYQAALLQLVRSSEQEIAQRKVSAQRFYGIAPGDDERRFLAQLRAVEPSNAETLSAALERERSLQASYDRTRAPATTNASLATVGSWFPYR